ncbi:hypothetical protein ACN267_21645 [Micromonospora sp. WMMD734]|nr:hypothetical protein [Micromonospora sp. WMMD712]WFE59496.1 hypothetical protein O7633_22770 [Micromonospora sp. WMMD712]
MEHVDDPMEQIDVLVSTLQELDVTDDGREALVAVEAGMSGSVV